jgi:hypothetical protein
MSETSGSLVVGRGHSMDFAICLCYRAESKYNRDYLDRIAKYWYKPGMTYVSDSPYYTSHDVSIAFGYTTSHVIAGEGIPVLTCKHCVSEDSYDINPSCCTLIHLVKYCEEYACIHNSDEADLSVASYCYWNHDHHYDSALLIQSNIRKFLFRKLLNSEKFAEWYYHPDNIGGVLAKRTFEKNMLEYNSAYYWKNSVDNLTKLVKFQRYTRKFLARKLAKSE